MLPSICQQILKTQQWPQDWKRSVFIPNSKKGNAKECSNYCTIALISHAWKVKILQARFQQYMNYFQTFKLDLEKAEEPEIKLLTHWIVEKAREFQKNIYFCFIDYAKAQFLEIRIPYHLTCLLWNLYADQEAIVRTGHGTTDWFKLGKGVHQGCILSPCLFNL